MIKIIHNIINNKKQIEVIIIIIIIIQKETIKNNMKFKILYNKPLLNNHKILIIKLNNQ